MKLITGVLVFLSAFILGYSFADYAKSSSRLYVIEGKDLSVQWRKGGKEAVLALKNCPEVFVYFSKEKPKSVKKNLSREEFIKNWQEIKAMGQGSFFLSVDAPSGDPHYQHALVQDVFYESNESALMLKVLTSSQGVEDGSLPTPKSREEHFQNVTLNLFQLV